MIDNLTQWSKALLGKANCKITVTDKPTPKLRVTTNSFLYEEFCKRIEVLASLTGNYIYADDTNTQNQSRDVCVVNQHCKP